jgi:KDO2-lipid IV(A) lauroyltransferase
MNGDPGDLVPDPGPAGLGPETGADRVTTWTFRSVEWLGMRLPRPVGLVASEELFHGMYRFQDEQRRVVEENLAQVLGHPPGSPIVALAARECFRLYGRYWYETFALRSMPAEDVRRRFTVEGMDIVDRALAAGKGIVVALPHMGNWDAAGHWLCLSGYPMTAVAEELRPRGVFDLFYRHRRALGMNIIPLAGSRVAERLVDALQRNQVLTLVADRDLTGRGVEVEMFGRPRRLPAGPARLALGVGAPLAVAAVFTRDDGWHCEINPPIEIERTGDMRADVAAMTRVMAAQFERFIAASPVDWYMFQPAWADADGEVDADGDGDTAIRGQGPSRASRSS